MTWIACSDWSPPPSHWDVGPLWSHWVADSVVMLFWIAYEQSEGSRALYSQPATGDASLGSMAYGAVTRLYEPDPQNSAIARIERTASGYFDVELAPEGGPGA